MWQTVVIGTFFLSFFVEEKISTSGLNFPVMNVARTRQTQSAGRCRD